jgi:hypothetical protein
MFGLQGENVPCCKGYAGIVAACNDNGKKCSLPFYTVSFAPHNLTVYSFMVVVNLFGFRYEGFTALLSTPIPHMDANEVFGVENSMCMCKQQSMQPFSCDLDCKSLVF